MKRYAVLVALAAMVLSISACSTQTSNGSAATEAAVNKGVTPPPGSPLAKIKLGMNKKQVKDLIGQPTDENSYATGKAWIPWYFGNDARRTSYYYKGMGRVVFADGNVFGGGSSEVVRIDYDPKETGNAP